jgi:hypothetical protein
VALLLLLQALLERLHQLVPAHGFDLGLVLGAELALQLLQPVLRNFLGQVGQHLHALEIGGKSAVVLVVVLLVLDQNGSAQVIEVVQAPAILALGADDARVQRFQQGQKLLDRHRQLWRRAGCRRSRSA